MAPTKCSIHPGWAIDPDKMPLLICTRYELILPIVQQHINASVREYNTYNSHFTRISAKGAIECTAALEPIIPRAGTNVRGAWAEHGVKRYSTILKHMRSALSSSQSRMGFSEIEAQHCADRLARESVRVHEEEEVRRKAERKGTVH